MINTKKGNVKIKGTPVETLADFSAITNAIYEDFQKDIGKDNAKNVLIEAFETGLKTEEELQQKKKDIVLNILKGLTKALESEEEVNE